MIIWAASAVLEGIGANGEESENLKGGRERGRCKGAGSASARPELSKFSWLTRLGAGPEPIEDSGN